MEQLHSQKITHGSVKKSTLTYVDVAEIRDDTIVLKSGALRAILLTSSLNFDLKSSEEQDGIIYAYQNFLNSLDFPLQVIVSSRKFNITPYIKLLDEKEKHQKNELLRLQTQEYRAFIKSLTEISNIMEKSFYIVIPFSPVESKRGGFFQKISDIMNPQSVIIADRERFETYKSQLVQRVQHISSGLSGTGMRLTQLKTDELIELLYNSYNPTSFANTIIRDVDSLELQHK